MPSILYEKRPDGIGLITLNRPERLNALNTENSDGLSQYLQEIANDPEVRCLALTGAGRAFCAGGDVKRMNSENEEKHPKNPTETTLETLTEITRRKQNQTSGFLHAISKPTVALVNGHAVGAGLCLALACDLRLASTTAKFGTAFRNVGLSGDYGGSYFMQNLIGSGYTRELYFTGEIIDAKRALSIGLINRIFPADSFMADSIDFCAAIANGPTRALGRMKNNLNLAEKGSLQEVMDQEALNMRLSDLDTDHREAAKAFVEKRKPNFIGR